MRLLRFLLGLVILFTGEILRVYWIMPFPGSQVEDRIDAAYFLHHNLWWIRLIGLALVAGPSLYYWRTGRWGRKIALLVPLLLYALVFGMFHFKLMADKMFYPPKTKVMAAPQLNDSTANNLVIGVEMNGDARAYPIELIGYHHQVLDTIGGEPVLITYCTVCRTGRAFSPKVNGEDETFRLVGMDHFNAMFEDGRTGSWWRQVNGECVAGPLKGQHLQELPFVQLSLREWVKLYPNSLIFQPDTLFNEEYAGLKDYDEGTIDGPLEHRDTASWEKKSWVVGVEHNGVSRAYDWNDLKRLRVIHDTLDHTHVTIELLSDGISHRVCEELDPEPHAPYKPDTPSYDPTWEIICLNLSDTLDDHRSLPISSSQEFWHSWHTFHPNTTRYVPPGK